MEEASKDKKVYKIKCSLIGKYKVGKSKFFDRFIHEKTSQELMELKQEQYWQTIGTDFGGRDIEFNNKCFHCLIWDTAGDDRYHSLLNGFIRSSNVFLLFYDAFDRNSFIRVKNIYEEIKNNFPNGIFYFVRSKYDLNGNINNDDFISDEEVLEYADKDRVSFAHLSLFEKYDNGIDYLLNLIAPQLISQINNNIIKET